MDLRCLSCASLSHGERRAVCNPQTKVCMQTYANIKAARPVASASFQTFDMPKSCTTLDVVKVQKDTHSYVMMSHRPTSSQQSISHWSESSCVSSCNQTTSLITPWIIFRVPVSNSWLPKGRKKLSCLGVQQFFRHTQITPQTIFLQCIASPNDVQLNPSLLSLYQNMHGNLFPLHHSIVMIQLLKTGASLSPATSEFHWLTLLRLCFALTSPSKNI